MIKNAIIAYLASGLAMLGADAVWLSFSASRIYKPRIGEIMLDGFRVTPAILFYFIYVLGIVLLVVLPALAERRMALAIMRGAMLGFVAYATYDLTNQATLKTWSTFVTVADLCWGTFLTAFAATIGYWVTTLIAPRIG
jgi:uncharacterized membrane protein